MSPIDVCTSEPQISNSREIVDGCIQESGSSTVFKNLDLDSRSRIDDSLDLDLSIGSCRHYTQNIPARSTLSRRSSHH